MKILLKLSKNESACLRQQLECHLVYLFSNNTISKYTIVNSNDHALQIANFPDLSQFPDVKQAYGIWLGMRAADRHTVLNTFNNLYANLPTANTGNRKILTFCALFINELAATFTEVMDQPH